MWPKESKAPNESALYPALMWNGLSSGVMRRAMSNAHALIRDVRRVTCGLSWWVSVSVGVITRREVGRGTATMMFAS